MIDELLQELATFPKREEGLRAIKRYHIYKTFFYRSSDFSHSKRVAWLLASIGPLLMVQLGDTFDIKRAFALALVHDDAELLIGDEQAGNKKNMTKEQLAFLDANERKAIDALSQTFPSMLAGYNYKNLLLEVADIATPEAQVVKYIDRFDAMGEALHELYAGNSCVNTNVITEYGLITLPFQSYYEALPNMLEKHPTLTQLKDSQVFFNVPEQRDWNEVVQGSKPHTLESLKVQTGHPQYDAWKKVVLEAGDSEEIKNLYTQIEF